MLAHRLRRWLNFKTKLAQPLVFLGHRTSVDRKYNWITTDWVELYSVTFTARVGAVS